MKSSGQVSNAWYARYAVFAAGAVLFCIFRIAFGSSQLSYVSDLVTTSAPATSTDQTITFETTTAIPPSGSIVVSYDNAAFAIPDNFSYADVDFATSSALAGTYADRPLAAAAGSASDGLAVATSTATLTFTLNSAQGIAAGTFVRIRMGTNASFGGAGIYQMTTPSSPGAYHVRLTTYDASSAELDYGSTVITILAPIDMEANTIDLVPPVLSNGLPSGTVPAGITQLELSLNTDKFATCHYATSTGIAYASSTNVFTHTNDTLHTALLSGIADGTSYNFYVRCMNFAGTVNTSDYDIAFTTLSPVPPPSSGGGGGPGGSGPGNGPYFFPSTAPASLAISGKTFPFAAIAVLQDGATSTSLTADSSGNFGTTLAKIAQGTYAFSLIGVDRNGVSTRAHTATITLVGGTSDALSGILLSPTLVLAKDEIDPAATVLVSGFAAPSSSITVSASKVAENGALGAPVLGTADSDIAGAWNYALKGSDLGQGTFEVKAENAASAVQSSDFSNPAYLGVGQAPKPPLCGNADLNGDGKVNLTDFSILLFNWGKSGRGDLNCDGKVNLTDFSILLFHWTG